MSLVSAKNDGCVALGLFLTLLRQHVEYRPCPQENIPLLPLLVLLGFPHLLSRALFWLVAWLALSVIV